MLYLTRPQRISLKKIYDRYPETTETYRQFRKRVNGGFGFVTVYWLGMWLGIERDGYTHT